MNGKNLINKREVCEEEQTGYKIMVVKADATGAKAKPKSEQGTDLGSGNKIAVKPKSVRHRKSLPSLLNVERDVKQYIIGQDEAVRKIITSIYRARSFKSIKANVLVIGGSGTGKTETVKQVAKRMNVPYTIEDATKYTQEGYYGCDPIEMVYNLIREADYDLEAAERGIIVIDEIDKKAGTSGEDRDVSGVEVLKSLLKIIEGTTVKVPLYDGAEEFADDDDMVDFDTKNIVIIFMGAFSGLEKIRDKRLNTNKLGFSVSSTTKPEKSDSRFLKQDLVKYGMPEEFVGRIDTIVEMNKLTKENLTSILKDSKLSIFRRYQTELKRKGIELQYHKKMFEQIAEQSLSLDTGARELSNTVNYIFENIMYEVLANPKKYHRCILKDGIVYDNTKYELFWMIFVQKIAQNQSYFQVIKR